MCGISGTAGAGWQQPELEQMVHAQRHRGPDDTGLRMEDSRVAGLGHNRLSIIDLSPAGQGPMQSVDSSCWLAFNGEIYNYLELRRELSNYPYRTQTDTEVILAAYQRWGRACLDRFIGMFALVIWDRRTSTLLAARDRFGVKPLHYHAKPDGTLLVASEIKALHAAGVEARPDKVTWATYLTHGLSDHSERTFWDRVRAVPPGHFLTWHDGKLRVEAWYDLPERVGQDDDTRPDQVVMDEYRALLEDSVRLRFRSDVPVGINLSGGLDSSTLLGLVQRVQGEDCDVAAFTFVTGDERYDELPWVRQMLDRTRHPSVVCRLDPRDIPELAASVQMSEDEPFGGLPTLAYARLFERARERGVIVLLDGQGLDEQWAGYDYYAQHLGVPSAIPGDVSGPVQGSRSPACRPECLNPEFLALAEPMTEPRPFRDSLRNRQYVDARLAKIPRALRFNDRVSMRVSTELREPFLDHRLFELALRQPPIRKIRDGTHKALLRDITRSLLPAGVVEAPKRPVQTPQREWLRGPLRDWARERIELALGAFGGTWLDRDSVRREWEQYQGTSADSSFHIWQWVNLGLWQEATLAPRLSQASATVRRGATG